MLATHRGNTDQSSVDGAATTDLFSKLGQIFWKSWVFYTIASSFNIFLTLYDQCRPTCKRICSSIACSLDKPLYESWRVGAKRNDIFLDFFLRSSNQVWMILRWFLSDLDLIWAMFLPTSSRPPRRWPGWRFTAGCNLEIGADFLKKLSFSDISIHFSDFSWLFIDIAEAHARGFALL